jgi:hypothetical protein
VEITINGAECPSVAGNANALTDANMFQFECMLPPGTGMDAEVLAILEVSDAVVFQSAPVYLLSYALPNISAVECAACTQDSSSALSECPRQGGFSLTITGTDFGAQGSVVLVGAQLCTNLVHDQQSPTTKVICTLPPGVSADTPILLIQAGGSVSGASASIAYEQCPPGTFQDGSEVVCGICVPGTITARSGAFVCEDCEAGKYSNVSICEDCASGRYAAARSPSCTQCAPGTFTSDTTTKGECKNCDFGTFQDQHGQSACELCAAGRAQAFLGQSSCVACDDGKVSSEGAAICEDCEAGKYSNVSICEDCA